MVRDFHAYSSFPTIPTQIYYRHNTTMAISLFQDATKICLDAFWLPQGIIDRPSSSMVAQSSLALDMSVRNLIALGVYCQDELISIAQTAPPWAIRKAEQSTSLMLLSRLVRYFLTFSVKYDISVKYRCFRCR